MGLTDRERLILYIDHFLLHMDMSKSREFIEKIDTLRKAACPRVSFDEMLKMFNDIREEYAKLKELLDASKEHELTE